jgi:site-specific DNA-cytosine methylase
MRQIGYCKEIAWLAGGMRIWPPRIRQSCAGLTDRGSILDTSPVIGGPLCQAYSVAGRSRRTNDKNFHKDEKHFLYREYLRIIKVHRPTIFVMENVKGLLSSKHSGNPMFQRILQDLSTPDEGLELMSAIG